MSISNATEKYISRIEKPCGGREEYIVIFKHEYAEDAVKRILNKCTIKQKYAEFYFKCTFEEREVNVFVDGKLLLKKIKSEEEAQQVLDRLLDDSSMR